MKPPEELYCLVTLFWDEGTCRKTPYHLSLISHTVGDSEITLRVVALLGTDPTAKQLKKFSN